MNIYEKMLKATEQIETVAKNLDVGFGKNSYKAVGEADVLNAVKPIEIELGIYSYPISREIVESEVFTVEKEYNGTTTKTDQKFIRVKTVYRFINTEKPEEYIDIVSYGDGVDPQDKAPGKALTYADKYALLKAYKIQTGEDTDKNKSEEGRFSRGNKNKVDGPLMEGADNQINDSQAKRIKELIKATNTKEDDICKHYKISSIGVMSERQYADCVKLLGRKQSKAKPKEEQMENLNL